MQYRPEIDGLRALAIIPVILFHAGFELFAGGFVGVDVFFVISGYLITMILLENIENQTFSITNFYERRARRILPAIYFILLFLSLYGLYKSPEYAMDLYQSIFATTIFSQNILLYIEGLDYFGIDSNKKPLLHTWSLGVEEQFYLIWPLLLFWLSKVRNSFMYFIIGILFLTSFLYSVYETNINPKFSFYMIFSRSWELILGAIIAIYINRKSIIVSNFSRHFSLVGLLLILFAIIYFDENTIMPGWNTLIPTFGTALILLFSTHNLGIGKLLSQQYIVKIGLISYSLYLWHQPVLVIVKEEFSSSISSLGGDLLPKILILFIIFILATFSYLLIEKPMRYLVPRRVFIIFTLLLTIFFIVISFLGHITNGYINLKLGLAEGNKNLYINHKNEVQRKLRHGFNLIKNNDNEILFIGDSMSQDIQLGFKLNDISSDYFPLDGSCFKAIIQGNEICNTSLKTIIKTIRNYKYIFISSDFIKENSQDAAFELWKKLSSFKPTFVIGAMRFKHVSDISYQLIKRTELNVNSYFYNSLDERTFKTNSFLKEKLGNFYISKFSFFCKKKSCTLYNNDIKPLFHDELHMTIEGSKSFGSYIIKKYLSSNVF